MKYTVTTRSGNLNLRAGPGTSYRLVGSLKKGAVVDIESIQGKWAKLTGKPQYAHADFLTKVGSSKRPRALPKEATMWSNYPNEDAATVKRKIGGAVNSDWVTNTCVVRLSAALNASGHPVPSALPGLATAKGADGKSYGLRVREIRKYLEDTYGPPTYVYAGAGAKAALTGKRGIILFEVRGLGDATGHVDLWDGHAARYDDYFSEAHEVLLWEY